MHVKLGPCGKGRCAGCFSNVPFPPPLKFTSNCPFQREETSTFICFFSPAMAFHSQNQPLSKTEHCPQAAHRTAGAYKSVFYNVNAFIKGINMPCFSLISRAGQVQCKQTHIIMQGLQSHSALSFTEMKTFSYLRLIGGAVSVWPIGV